MNVKALILDFNGVVADDEEIHCKAFQEAFREIGLDLLRADYFDRYLPMDDAGVVRRFLSDRARSADPRTVRALCLQKERVYQRLVAGGVPLVHGAREFVISAAARWPVAIASGAIRREIEETLLAHGLAGCVSAIVAAEDVSRGKPDPEPYQRALDLLNRGRGQPIAPAECVVVEDAPAGIAAARAAGMRAIGLATSFPSERLAAADRVVRALSEIAPDRLVGLMG